MSSFQGVLRTFFFDDNLNRKILYKNKLFSFGKCLIFYLEFLYNFSIRIYIQINFLNNYFSF